MLYLVMWSYWEIWSAWLIIRSGSASQTWGQRNYGRGSLLQFTVSLLLLRLGEGWLCWWFLAKFEAGRNLLSSPGGAQLWCWGSPLGIPFIPCILLPSLHILSLGQFPPRMVKRRCRRPNSMHRWRALGWICTRQRMVDWDQRRVNCWWDTCSILILIDFEHWYSWSTLTCESYRLLFWSFSLYEYSYTGHAQ